MAFAVLGTGRGIVAGAIPERLNPGEVRLDALLRLTVPPARRSPGTPRSSVVYRIDSLRCCGLEPNCTAAKR